MIFFSELAEAAGNRARAMAAAPVEKKAAAFALVVNLTGIPKNTSQATAAAAAACLPGFTTSNVVKQQGWWNFGTPAEATLAAPHLLATFPGSTAKGRPNVVPHLAYIAVPVGGAPPAPVGGAAPAAKATTHVAGTKWHLRSLTSKAGVALNGKVVEVVPSASTSGRVTVKLAGSGSIVTVKPLNLVPLPGASCTHTLTKCATFNPTFSCDGCGAAPMPQGASMYSCRACNVDLCMWCSTAAQRPLWEFEDGSAAGSGTWVAIGDAVSSVLEAAFALQPPPDISLVIAKRPYLLSVSSMSQCNVSTNTTRALRRQGVGAKAKQKKKKKKKKKMPAAAAAATPPATWEYEDGAADSGVWCACDSTAGSALEAAFAQPLQPDVTLTIGGKPYTFSVTSMRQTNVATGFTRALRRHAGGAQPKAKVKKKKPAAAAAAAASPAAVWEYENGNAGSANWCACSEGVVTPLEAAFAQPLQPDVTLTIGGKPYTFSVTSMRQTNVATGFTRALRRHAGGAQPKAKVKKKKPAAAAAAAASPAAVWEYENGNAGSANWCACSEGVVTSLEAAFALPLQPDVTLAIGGTTYSFSVSSLTQQNTTTGFTRALRRHAGGAKPKVKVKKKKKAAAAAAAAASPAAAWFYEDDNPGSGNWKSCDEGAAAALEAAFALPLQPDVTLAIGGTTYSLSVSSLTQQNTTTGYTRALRRQAGGAKKKPVKKKQPPVPPPAKKPAAAPQPQVPCLQYEDGNVGSGDWKPFSSSIAAAVEGALATTPLPANLTVSIHGKSYVLDLTHPMSQTNVSTSFVRSIRRMLWEYEDGSRDSGNWKAFDGPSATLLTGAFSQVPAPTSVSLSIAGPSSHVVRFSAMTQTNATTSFVRNIRHHANAAKKGSFSGLPSHWSPMSSQLEIVDLASGSAEYKKVLADFQKTGCTGKTILAIKRIQNPVRSWRCDAASLAY